MKEKISNLLIGNKGSSNYNKVSTKLIGNLKDKDRDGYPLGFSKFVDDCNDSNKNKDGWISNVVKTVKNIVSPPKPSTPSKPSTPYSDSKLSQTISPGNQPTTSIKNPTPSAAPSTPSSSTSTKKSSGGGGGGGQTIEQITTPTSTTPYAGSNLQKAVEGKTTTPTTGGYVTTTPTGGTSYKTGTGSTPFVNTTPIGGGGGGQKIEQITAYQNQVAQQKLYEDYQQKIKSGEIAGMSIMPNAKEEAKKLLLAKGNFIPQTQTSQGEYMIYTTPQPFKKPTRIKDVIPESYENIEVRKARGLTGDIKEDIKPLIKKYKESTVGRIISGDIGESYVGINLSPSAISKLGVSGGTSLFMPTYGTKPTITARQVKEQFEKYNIPFSGFIPTTPLGVATTIGLPGGLGYLSKGGKIAKGISYGVDIGFTGLSGYQLTKAETTKEKIEAVTGLGLGIAGLTSTKGIKSSKIAESITQAETKLVSKGFIKKTDLSKFNLNEADKIKIENLINTGYSVRESEISLVPKQGLEKTTPKVSGKVLELINQEGDVAQRIAVGRDIKIELGKKKVTQDVYSETLLKVGEEGNIKGITDVVTRTKQQKVLGIGEQAYPKNKISISRLTEETKQIGQTGKDKTQAYFTETKTGLLQQEKFTGQPTILKQFAKQKLDVPVSKREDTMLLYHVTAKENVPGILKEGLMPSKGTGIHGVIGESDRVYTTLSRPVAEKYNIMLGNKGKILEINVPKEEVFAAIKEDAKLRTGVGQIGQVTFGYISPEKISAPGMTVRNGAYLKILPDFESAVKMSKPSSISRSIEVQKQTGSKGLKLGSDEGFLISQKYYQTKGKSISINTKEVLKQPKPIKSFRIVEEAISKPKEYKQPEIKSIQSKQILEEPRPTYVGGESTQSSLLYSKGGTKGIIRESIYQSAPKLAQRDLTSLKGKSSLSSNLNLEVQTSPRLSTGVRSTQIQNVGLFSNIDTSQEQLTKQEDKTLLKEQSNTIQLFQPAIKEDTLLKEGLKQTQKLKQEQRQLTKQRPTQVYPKTPTQFNFNFEDEITPRIKFELPKSKKKLKQRKFITEVRRRGTFTPVSESSTLGQAFGIGVSKVKSSLAASFRVIEQGINKPIKFNLNLPEFTQAKKESGVIVQKRSQRLSSLFERTEIQQARKRKIYI